MKRNRFNIPVYSNWYIIGILNCIDHWCNLIKSRYINGQRFGFQIYINEKE